MVTNNSWNSEDPAQVSKGGTGAATLNDGFVLLGSGTSPVTPLDVTAKGSILAGDGTTDPVALAVGSNAQVLTADSGEASGLKWATNSANGDYVFISTATASSDATIDFTGLSATYFAYKIFIEGLLPANDNVELWFRTSTDNGSNYDVGANDYSYATVNDRHVNPAAQTLSAIGAATHIQLSSTPLGNAANEEAVYEVTIYNPSSTTYTKIDAKGIHADQSANQNMDRTSGVRLSAADVDAVRFLMSAGNISTGVFKLYGIEAS